MDYAAKDLAETMKRRRTGAQGIKGIMAQADEAPPMTAEEEADDAAGIEETPSGKMTKTPELALVEEEAPVEGVAPGEGGDIVSQLTPEQVNQVIEALLGAQGGPGSLGARARSMHQEKGQA